MNILVLGGTRFFGKQMVYKLLQKGHNVTIDTRGIACDDFGNKVTRIIIERTNSHSLKQALKGKYYDVVYDSLAYCSNDVIYLLDVVSCDRYIMTSSTAVYRKHIDTKEEDFNTHERAIAWCGKGDLPYDENKRQAEYTLWQQYSNINSVAVRFPFVIGNDDYTKRLAFYVGHIIHGIPMDIDNYNKQMAFVRSDEAGSFMAFLAENSFTGAINGSSPQTISIKEISEYVMQKTGKEIKFSSEGDNAPFNSENEYSINIDKATELGFVFTPLKKWIYKLLDYYIEIYSRSVSI